MKVDEIFRLRTPDRFGHWGLERIPTRDALLTTPLFAARPGESEEQRTARMAALDLGTVWAGYLKPLMDSVSEVVDSLSPEVRQGVLGKLSEYRANENTLGSSTLREGPSGSLASIGDADTRDTLIRGRQLYAERLHNMSVGDTLNEQHRKFWGQRSLRP